MGRSLILRGCVGEPYVYRYAHTQATALLAQLGLPIPELPPNDPSNDEKYD